MELIFDVGKVQTQGGIHWLASWIQVVVATSRIDTYLDVKLVAHPFCVGGTESRKPIVTSIIAQSRVYLYYFH